jgi:hypothetical protein
VIAPPISGVLIGHALGNEAIVAVARRLGRRLIIAGNISPLAHEQAYFADAIAPQLDGDRT